MQYNFLNLPSYISVSEDDYMDYTWYYDGTKVSVEGYEGSYGADYIGSFVYNNDDDGFIRDINFGDGIVTETAEDVYETVYWVTDHLGSPRVAFKLDNSEYASVVERNDYYPFGGRWDDGSGHGGTIAATDNSYALSGKERQTMSRMGTYLATHESLLDFGARFYDPATAIFLQQDPLAEKYYNLSPYAYCANNPVNFVDLDGRDTVYVFDIPTRPRDRGVPSETYTAETYVEINGIVTGPYRSSSYPNSKSPTDNSPGGNTINEGVMMNFNNKYGHNKSTEYGLNIVNDSGERKTEGTDPDGNSVGMTLVNVHSGHSNNGNYNSRGSYGCITIHPDDAMAFFKNFTWYSDKFTGSSFGKIIVYRTNSKQKIDQYNQILKQHAR